MSQLWRFRNLQRYALSTRRNLSLVKACPFAITVSLVADLIFVVATQRLKKTVKMLFTAARHPHFLLPNSMVFN